MTLFVDTSALYAAVDADDRNNAGAGAVLSAGEALLTTDHVLVETWLFVNARLGFPTAERVVEETRAAATLEVVGAADLEKALAISEAFPDQEFSLVDRTSFAVMERLGVHRVVAYDAHFAIYRYGRKRQHAFAVVRSVL